MRRANHLLSQIADPDNLRYASWKAARGKRYSRGVLEYQRDLEGNLQDLRRQILAGQVQVGDYRHFKVYEPKERNICASAFREQVLHHALMNICHERFEQAQIFDSYASRKGKGTYAALGRAKTYCRKYDWFLKLDIQKFFESIDHEVIKSQLSCIFKEPMLLAIFAQIIDSYQARPGRGVPIGNLTSQYLANHYLLGLDHFIKEQLHIRAYVRYMDDMVLWHDDKAVLEQAVQAVCEFVENRLNCSLKPIQLNQVRLGLPFLGYRIFPHYVRLLQNSKVRYVRKLRRIDIAYDTGEWTEVACQRRALPLVAFTRHADTLVFRKAVSCECKGITS